MSAQPKILGVETYATPAKWLKLETIRWADQDGKERQWEVANRTTRPKAGVDSVHILALLHKAGETSVLLIEQYRPPVAAFVVELPAGLVDEGESVETAALRELHEETGYAGARVKIRRVSPVLVKDPGMTGANMHLVTVDIAIDAGEPDPEQKLDDGEHITKRVVALAELYPTLHDYAKKGFAVDALVASVAEGLAIAGGSAS
ncbi:hypothetical protein Q5752_001317 [Cryptotrichosporon argae]